MIGQIYFKILAMKLNPWDNCRGAPALLKYAGIIWECAHTLLVKPTKWEQRDPLSNNKREAIHSKKNWNW